MNKILTKFTIMGFVAIASYFFFTSCTVIRYVDPTEKKEKEKLPPKVVDMLVLVDLGRATTNLTEDFGTILTTLQAALAGQNMVARKTAMAPMYGRSEGVVPIVYGTGDPKSEFQDYASAILFYARDNGNEYLRDRASSDIANLATLGKNLDQRAIYHPTTADPESKAYFEAPKHGLIVVHLSATPRLCSASDVECASVDGMPYSTYFTQEVEDKATWLKLPGETGLPAAKIFHLVIATEEGVDYGSFQKKCKKYPNFPATKLDVMEPSEKVFFHNFVKDIASKGGKSGYVDLCEAMSKASVLSLGKMSLQIRAALK